MASISADLKKKKGYIISAAPQSTNFNPTNNSIDSGSWNTYVTLVNKFPDIDAIGIQWYEPGGSKPKDTVEDITAFIKEYMNESWVVTGSSGALNQSPFEIGKWVKNNSHKLIIGIGAGSGWNGVSQYDPKNLVAAYNNITPKFGGFMVWDVEFDSGVDATCLDNAGTPNTPWKYGNEFKNILS